mmetsp:Transcript_58544/g.181825  ORF Transcript_58544/g.181825 Transcript_58544/m.181825 type:complete len:251 (-) Transcript_58544:10-762(-)
MAKEVQVTIGMDALSQMAKSRWPTKAIDKLTEEVCSAKSIVVVTGEGRILRLVSLVVLRLERGDGRLLVHVGKWDGSRFEAECQLPGLKQERDELVGETVARMLGTKLKQLEGQVHVESVVRDNKTRMSKEYGVQTRYLLSVCEARLLGRNWPSRQESCGLTRLQRSQSRMSTGSQVLRSTLQTLQVAEVLSGPDFSLYAWLPPEVFESLSVGGAAVDQAMKAWLAEMPAPAKPEEYFNYDGNELTVVAI